MKKAIWIIAVLGLVLTAAVLASLPETVPVHFDAAWNPDRWGSRWELLLLPAVLLLLAGIFTLVMNVWEKKVEGAENDKVRAEALTNRKASGIAGISTVSMLVLIFAWLLLRISRAAADGGAAVGSALDRLPFILMGLIFIVLGNIMPKTRRNGFIGFRISWSMYNDVTWRRTHRFSGYVMVAAGVLMILAAALISPPLAATAVLLALAAAALLVTLVYAHKVYREEKERSGQDEN